MRISPIIQSYLPLLEWLPTYTRYNFARDALAAIVVALVLIPQSLAYALLAGMPPVTGLYASMVPLVAYAVFGTSRSLAVDPYTHLVDVLQRVGLHPARRVVELTPRLWKSHFAGTPMRSDIDRVDKDVGA